MTTVDVTDNGIETADFAFTAFIRAFKSAILFEGLRGSYELERLFTMDHHGNEVWLWSHMGNGDFMRLSNSTNGRWAVVFEHESERSPWGSDGKLADGFDWIDRYKLDSIKDSDAALGYPSICEIYFRKRDFKTAPFSDNKFAWTTSKEIADLDKTLDEFGGGLPHPLDAEYQALYDSLCKGHKPSLQELIDFSGNELVASSAFVALAKIDEWLVDIF